MKLILNEEQQFLKDTAKNFAEERTPVNHFRSLRDDNDSKLWDMDIWQEMVKLGWSGILIPEEFGGSNFGVAGISVILQECGKTLTPSPLFATGVLGAHAITHFGTEEQKTQFLPALASGEKRGGLALTEPGGGTDVANLKTRAEKDGEEYIVNGSKMFITNARHGDMFCLLARTDSDPSSKHKGLTAFVMEKGEGFRIGRDLDKLGYRGLDTCEIFFDNLRVPQDNVIGGSEGSGFAQVMSGLETGRINVAARAVGVAQAAFNAAIKYSQQRHSFGSPLSDTQIIQTKLADMATKIQAARLLTYDAAEKKDLGIRSDAESGMAKLFASEICQEVAMDAMRIHGGYGFIKDLPVERYYRDAPLMIIGEGTNEILRIVIARQLLKRPEYQIT